MPFFTQHKFNYKNCKNLNVTEAFFTLTWFNKNMFMPVDVVDVVLCLEIIIIIILNKHNTNNYCLYLTHYLKLLQTKNV